MNPTGAAAAATTTGLRAPAPAAFADSVAIATDARAPRAARFPPAPREPT
tara:strand:- start:2629 stop:2778 length:150 start_codon:yes stop_codon:yes gene_type:complete